MTVSCDPINSDSNVYIVIQKTVVHNVPNMNYSTLSVVLCAFKVTRFMVENIMLYNIS